MPNFRPALTRVLLLLPILSFFPGASLAQDEEIKVEISAPKYLYFSWFTRVSRNLEADAKITLDQQPAKTNYRTTIDGMTTELYAKNAVSLEEFQFDRMRANNSVLDLDNLYDQFIRNDASGTAFNTQRSFSAGASVDLEDLYNMYAQIWDSECSVFTRSIQNETNSYNFWSKKYIRTKKLVETEAVSEQELWQVEAQYYKAKLNIEAMSRKSETCDKGIPTLEWLKEVRRAPPQNDGDGDENTRTDDSALSSAAIPDLSVGTATDPTPKVQTSPPAYMTFYDFMRSMRIKRDNAKIQMERDRIMAELYRKMYERRVVLFEKNAVSEKELRRFKKMHLDKLNGIQTQAQFIKLFDASVEINTIQMHFAEGKLASLDEMYKHYEDFWGADCGFKKHFLKSSEIELEFNTWVVKANEKLLESKAVSYEEYLGSVTRMKSNKVKNVELTEIYATCHDDIPTLEYLQNIGQQPPSDNSIAVRPPSLDDEPLIATVGSDVKVSVNPPSYLLLYFIAHETKYSEIQADIDAKKIIFQAAAQEKVAIMQKRLLELNAASYTEYINAKNLFNTSLLLSKKLDVLYKKAQADKSKFNLQASWAAGTKPNLQELYALYRKSYDEQCDSQNIDIDNATVQLAHRKILVDISRRLIPSKAETMEAYQFKVSQQDIWQMELEHRKKIHTLCLSDIPTFEYIKGIKSFLPEEN